MEYTMTTHMNYRKEHLIYTSIWLMLYLSPLASLYMRMSSNPNIAFSWHEILNAWAFNTIWLVLMLIHNFLLLPVLIIAAHVAVSGVVFGAPHLMYVRFLPRQTRRTALTQKEKADGDERP